MILPKTICYSLETPRINLNYCGTDLLILDILLEYSACWNTTKWFCGLVGYGICLTRRTSPVRSWAESFFFIFVYLRYNSSLSAIRSSFANKRRYVFFLQKLRVIDELLFALCASTSVTLEFILGLRNFCSKSSQFEAYRRNSER